MVGKTIDTLVEDILAVIDGQGGWGEVANNYFKDCVGETLRNRIGEGREERKGGTLRMSSIGQPCARKLWYSINQHEEAEVLLPEAKLKFLYGDLLEDLLLSLAKAAGHDVQGQQDTMSIKGIKGHRDAVIDGVNVDVKSASPFSFKKFKAHDLEGNDPFGYMTQLSSYVFASKDDPLVVDKKGGAFLVIDKVSGKLCLDYYDFEKTGHLNDVEALYDYRIDMSKERTPPPREFPTEPEGKAGNRKLGVNCSYCDYKKVCFPGLRAFKYYNGPVFFDKIVKEPKVPEIPLE